MERKEKKPTGLGTRRYHVARSSKVARNRPGNDREDSSTIGIPRLEATQKPLNKGKLGLFNWG